MFPNPNPLYCIILTRDFIFPPLLVVTEGNYYGEEMLVDLRVLEVNRLTYCHSTAQTLDCFLFTFSSFSSFSLRLLYFLYYRVSFPFFI